VTAVVGEAGVRLEFGNDLVRMIPCRLVINEDGSHFVINLLPVVEDKKVSRHAEPRRSDPFTIVPFKLHAQPLRGQPDVHIECQRSCADCAQGFLTYGSRVFSD
jgi:hypothetical protein